MARKISNFLLYILDSDWLNVIHFSGYKYKISLDIKKKRGSSINLNIHYSKVFTSVFIVLV